MSCSHCSNAAFTCNRFSASVPRPCHCALTSITPAIPAHHFQLYCGNYCPPTICTKPSPNHGIGCNNFNGYHPPTCITPPGHNPSCPTCNTCPNPHPTCPNVCHNTCNNCPCHSNDYANTCFECPNNIYTY